MSDHEFHVHGAHDHQLEHAAEHGHGDAFASRVAITTAILATIGAMFSYMGGATQVNASLYKNNAAIKKTEASDQWNYYQAKGNKENLAELARVLVPVEQKEHFRAEAERYGNEKKAIKEEATHLEKLAEDWDEKSDHQMHLHHRWAQSTTVIQISIALSAIALLTRRNWLQRLVYGFAAIGMILGAFALWGI